MLALGLNIVVGFAGLLDLGLYRFLRRGCLCVGHVGLTAFRTALTILDGLARGDCLGSCVWGVR